MKYLTFKASVFVFLKNKNVLIYNSENGNKYNFICTTDILKIINDLLNVSNMYSVLLEDVLSDETNIWISKMVDEGFAFLSYNKRYLSIPPQLIVSPKCEQMKSRYLHRVVINLGGDEINSYYKQFYYPMSRKSNMDYSVLMKFIYGILKYDLNSLIFIVDDFREILKFSDLLNKLKKQVRITIIALFIPLDSLTCFDFNGLNIVLMYKNIHAFLKHALELDSVPNLTFGIVVESSLDLEIISLYMDNVNINLYPFYNGNNKLFFQEYIYENKTDLDDIYVSKLDVFRNQLINPLFFGQFYLLPDGKICADPNFPHLGSIFDPLDIILEGMMRDDSAWKYVRKMYPCSDCVYQWLCPPISNYEIAIESPLCFQYM